METHPAEIVVAIQIMQGVAALVLAALLLYFFSTFRHTFLRHWSLSAFALAVYLGMSAAALGLYWAGPEYDAARLLCSAVSLGAAYPHVVWLMSGTWEAVNQRFIPRRTELLLVASAALTGVLSAAVGAFDPQSGEIRNLVRVELRYALTGTAFVIAGVLLWRSQRGMQMVGARVGAAGFVLFGLQMFHVVGINVAIRGGYSPPFYFSYVGLIDFLFQSVIALGIVVWLLEIQQQRTRKAHRELEHLRLHDPTTGLPNRELLIEQIAEMMDRTGARRVAVVSVGMNRYATLNRALGWDRIERIMNEVSMQIHEGINPRCALARVSDRDFVVVRPTLDDPESICRWTESILAEVIQPLDVDGQEIYVTFCAGISVYPEDARDAETLLRHSQQALVQSAQLGRDVTLYQQLEAQGHLEAEAMLRFEGDLRRGLSKRQFEMHYQPIVAVADGRVAGFEALLRWRHPKRGLLRPAAFLDEAASIGVLDALESFALESTLKQMAAWNRQGRAALKVAVNISARCFQREGMVKEVIAACERFGVAPGQLELEITENTALRDLANAARQISALHEVGVSVALDDFGTGYSSLANLIKLPVNRIKLDREFIANALQAKRQRELVAAMIGLGHRLGLEVVAEGVETSAQLNFLAEHGCDLVQGFLLQEPVRPEECRFEPVTASAGTG